MFPVPALTGLRNLHIRLLEKKDVITSDPTGREYRQRISILFPCRISITFIIFQPPISNRIRSYRYPSTHIRLLWSIIIFLINFRRENGNDSNIGFSALKKRVKCRLKLYIKVFIKANLYLNPIFDTFLCSLSLFLTWFYSFALTFPQ